MPSTLPGITALSAAYAQARRFAPEPQAIVVLHLGDEQSILAWGTGGRPSQYASLQLGLSGLAERILSNGRLNEMAMEQIMAEVEDIVMPLHAKLPASAKLFSEDAVIAELAHWAGLADKAMQRQLGIDAVEHLFNRQVALAQGRPASQDDLPITCQLSAALLVLREWLHHLKFEEITVLGIERPDSEAQASDGP